MNILGNDIIRTKVYCKSHAAIAVLLCVHLSHSSLARLAGAGREPLLPHVHSCLFPLTKAQALAAQWEVWIVPPGDSGCISSTDQVNLLVPELSICS